MKKENEIATIGDILSSRKTKKPTAYEWQNLALRIINDLSIPNFKRSSVFHICKENPKVRIEQCLNDTKELCHTGEKWKYFFKLIGIK